MTASIGVYLSTANIAGEGYFNVKDSNYHSLGNTKDVTIPIDPSTMTDELFAFQESLKVAIANNELQDAIEQKYHQNQGRNTGPSVVIVTNSNYNSNPDINTEKNSDSNYTPTDTDSLVVIDKDSIENNYESATHLDNTTDISSSPVVDIVFEDPTVSTTSIVDPRKSEHSLNVGLAIGGIIGMLLMSLFLVSSLAVARRRRRRDNGSETSATIARLQEKIKKYHSTRHSNKNCRDIGDSYDQSGEKLLDGIYVANNYNNEVDEEKGLVGRMTRNGTSKLIHEIFSNEELEAIGATCIGSYSLDNNVVDERTISLSSDNSGKIYYENKVFPRIEEKHEERNVVGNVIEKTVVSSDDPITLKNECLSHVSTLKVGVYAKVSSSVDDEENDDYDFVFGEDDDSDSSVEQHLLSASRSSELNMAPLLQSSTNQEDEFTTTSCLSNTTNNGDLPSSPETLKKAIDSDSNQKSAPIPSQSPLNAVTCTQSNRRIEMMDNINPLEELHAAISKCDWATVGAKAAVLASINAVMQPSMPRHVNGRYSSLSVRSSDVLQKADELDRLIESGDWQAVVVTAAKYEAEGLSCEGSAIEERSKTSTQDSDANDSYVSIMDHSSEGQSNSICRSVMTPVSQKERLQEIREWVTKMVQEVVPDEVQNIDEMMIQFKGREEDLLEALQTMKERNAVRKARLESQKIARRNTRSLKENEGNSTSAIQPFDAKKAAIRNDSDVEQQEKFFITHCDNETNAHTPMNTDNAVKSNYTTEKNVRPFDHENMIDPDQAAAAAAAWAIQRSLNEMMENEGKASPRINK